MNNNINKLKEKKEFQASDTIFLQFLTIKLYLNFQEGNLEK